MDVSVPVWLKVSYTLFLLVLFPVYWRRYGPANFLWFSDISLLIVGVALWIESRMLVSMVAVGVLGLEIFWNLDYLGSLIRGKPWLGLSFYMFDSSKSLFLRSLSLFHVVLPAIVIWLLFKWGYNPDAIFWQLLLTWAVLLIVYQFTEPRENINWVFGLGNKPQTIISKSAYFWLTMVLFPIVILLPSHFVLKWFFD
jgi:hypothetical protein